MKTALIGHTGFVGSNISKQTSFTDCYNSKNIQDIRGKTYDLIFSAGNSSLKWKANSEPDADLANIQRFIEDIQTIKAKHYILISTVDVYPIPVNVNEDSPIDGTKSEPYGSNRYILEEFIRNNFEKHTIIRLPQLFGPGLKKNFIFDLIHNNRLDITHKDSVFQWYNMEHLWQDIQIALEHNLSLINFAVEPTSAKEIALYTLGMDFTTVTEKPPVHYDMHSKYANLFGSSSQYMYDKKTTLENLKQLILKEKV